MVATLKSTDPLDAELDTATGDVIIDEQGLRLIGGISGVAQLIGIALRLFRGEWFMNLDAGVPWFQDILGQKYDEATLRRRLSDEIATVPGVSSVTALSISRDSAARTVSIAWGVIVEFVDIEPTALASTTVIPVTT
jgi:hypothetical protein